MVIGAWYPSRMDLEPGQVAVITGGASGLGFALAESFADRGLMFAPHLVAQNSGTWSTPHVVNTASMAGISAADLDL
jgi:NADP-dependent 3-hydroxy acid dehydrogenase YdfG